MVSIVKRIMEHGAYVDNIRASNFPSDIFNIKHILVTECQLLSSGNLIQEGLLLFFLKPTSLNIKSELVDGHWRVHREGVIVRRMNGWLPRK